MGKHSHLCELVGGAANRCLDGGRGKGRSEKSRERNFSRAEVRERVGGGSRGLAIPGLEDIAEHLDRLVTADLAERVDREPAGVRGAVQGGLDGEGAGLRLRSGFVQQVVRQRRGEVGRYNGSALQEESCAWSFEANYRWSLSCSPARRCWRRAPA